MPDLSRPDRHTLELFFAKVVTGRDGPQCWLWQAGKGAGGCGVFNGQSAHRVAYEWFVGPIGEEEQIDHLCRTRSCVNPSHLEAVSPSENVRRAIWPGFGEGGELARNFKELRDKMSPEARAASEARTREMLAEMPLNHLRKARELTQATLARTMERSQGEVSLLERRTRLLREHAAELHRNNGRDARHRRALRGRRGRADHAVR